MDLQTHLLAIVTSITVTSRSGVTPNVTSPAVLKGQDDAEDKEKLDLDAQQRQRRLVPYFMYYVVNNVNAGNNGYSISQPSSASAQFQGSSSLDLLSRSVFSPYFLRSLPPARAPGVTPRFRALYATRPQNVPSYNTRTQSIQSYITPQKIQGYAPQSPNILSYTPRPQQATYLARPYDIFPAPSPTPERSFPLVKDNPVVYDITNEEAEPEVAELGVTEQPTTEAPAPTKAPISFNPFSFKSTSTRFPGPAPKKNGIDAPGRPGLDYPTLRKIPPTSFTCASQRYKGFFADPETKCQVWHYCDLNGGQASFLCPNGTIFSQVLLTCDWWFNVKCDNTLQAYVLNERLYKYIMPRKPSFPEDYSGPQVDSYLVKNLAELTRKEQAKFDKLKKKTKDIEFEDADELQLLLDKLRDGRIEMGLLVKP